MRILLTNDDGFEAEGIKELAQQLSEKYDVYMMAPDKNRSGVSHCISMASPLLVKEFKKNFYSCSGFPVDCAVASIRGFFNHQFDVVVSGINKGANLGTDIVFSGTAAAARQASMYGIPSIAVSLESYDGSWKYSALAKFVANNLEQLVTLCETDVFVNINAKSTDEYKGYKFTSPSRRDYQDSVSIYDAPNGKKYSFFVGGDVLSKGNDDSDEKAVIEDYISIGRIFSQPMNAGLSNKLQEKLCLKV